MRKLRRFICPVIQLSSEAEQGSFDLKSTTVCTIPGPCGIQQVGVKYTYSESSSSLFVNGNNSTDHMGLLWRLNGAKYVKFPAQGLALSGQCLVTSYKFQIQMDINR